MGNNRPIQGYRQRFPLATMGPFKVIGRIYHEQQWAHPKLLAVLLMGSNGPIQSY
jgi:hypothetical protein